MSRRDPGAATGGPVHEPGRCRCTHLETFHRLRSGTRGRCDAHSCPCKRYEEA